MSVGCVDDYMCEHFYMLLKGLSFIVIISQSTANLTWEMWVLYYCPEKKKLALFEAMLYLNDY